MVETGWAPAAVVAMPSDKSDIRSETQNDRNDPRKIIGHKTSVTEMWYAQVSPTPNVRPFSPAGLMNL